MSYTIYTREQLDAALLVILNWNVAYIKSAGICSACTHAAEACFIDMRPESLETKIIRSALKDLKEDGFFHFKGDK
jgi:hypothetical protein